MVSHRFQKLLNKHVLIFGGTAGIGYAVAEALHRAGMNRASLVALSGRGREDEGHWEHLHFVEHLVKPVAHEALVSLILRLQAQKQG